MNHDEINIESNLAFLSAIEIQSSLKMRYIELVEYLFRKGIIFDFYIYHDTNIYGYIGAEGNITQNIFGFKNLNKIKNTDTCYDGTVNYLGVYLTNDVFEDLHFELQNLCLPFNIYDEIIYYKLFSNNMLYGIEADDEYAQQFKEEFSLPRVYLIRNHVKELSKVSFDILLQMLVSTNHIAQNLNLTVKSLSKLSFHYILQNNLKKAYEVILDTLTLMKKEKVIDEFYISNMLRIRDEIIKRTDY